MENPKNILDDLELKKAISLARKKISSNQLGEARRICQDILVNFPHNKKAKDLLKSFSHEGQLNTIKHRNLEPTARQQNHLIELYKYDGLEAAIRLAKSLLKDFPQSASIYNLLGTFYSDANCFDEAVNCLKNAYRLGPLESEFSNNLSAALTNLGMQAKNNGETELAIKSFEEAISVKSNNAVAFNNLGTVFSDRDSFEEAVEHYKNAIKIDPDYALAHNNLGLVYKKRRQLDAALESFARAVDINTSNEAAYTNMGAVFLEKKDFGAAIEKFKKAIDINPNFFEAYSNLGAVFLEKKEFDAAIDQFNNAIEINSDDFVSCTNIAIAMQKKGDYKPAIAHYQRAIQINPEYIESHLNLGHLLREIGDTASSIESYKKVLEIMPGHPTGMHLLNSLSGITTSGAPRGYVEDLFNGYATNFDSALVSNLNYFIPKLIGELLRSFEAPSSVNSVVDLGCGTGLVGVELRKFCKDLVGVDLSECMLHEAEKKDAYDHLIHADIVQYLSTAELDFDYFILADVFIYIGDPLQIFGLIKSLNQRNGKLIFSIEDCDGDYFKLENSGRYSHSRGYIDQLCEKFSYRVSSCKEVDIRTDQGIPVSGSIYVLEF